MFSEQRKKHRSPKFHVSHAFIHDPWLPDVCSPRYAFHFFTQFLLTILTRCSSLSHVDECYFAVCIQRENFSHKPERFRRCKALMFDLKGLCFCVSLFICTNRFILAYAKENWVQTFSMEGKVNVHVIIVLSIDSRDGWWSNLKIAYDDDECWIKGLNSKRSLNFPVKEQGKGVTHDDAISHLLKSGEKDIQFSFLSRVLSIQPVARVSQKMTFCWQQAMIYDFFLPDVNILWSLAKKLDRKTKHHLQHMHVREETALYSWMNFFLLSSSWLWCISGPLLPRKRVLLSFFLFCFSIAVHLM